MPRPAPLDYLQAGEDILVDERRHPLSIVDDIIYMAVFLGLLAAGAVYAFRVRYPEGWVPFGVPILALLGALYVVFLVARYWRMTTSRYVLTKERAYKAHGRIRFFLSQTTYDRVTDIHVRQGLFGRIWNFGNIGVQTAGTGLNLDGVSNPFEVKNRLEEARTAFIESLIQEHAPGVGARRSTVDAVAPRRRREGPAEVRWRGRPTVAHFFSQILGSMFLIPVLVLVLLAMLAGAGEEGFPLPAIFILVFLGLSVMSVFLSFVRFKYTRYEVNTRGVVVTSGWLSRNRVETTYDKITDVTTNQGILARMFNFGNITVNTAGSAAAPVVFAGLSDPESVKAVIDEVRVEASGGDDG